MSSPGRNEFWRRAVPLAAVAEPQARAGSAPYDYRAAANFGVAAGVLTIAVAFVGSRAGGPRKRDHRGARTDENQGASREMPDFHDVFAFERCCRIRPSTRHGSRPSVEPSEGRVIGLRQGPSPGRPPKTPQALQVANVTARIAGPWLSRIAHR